MKFDLKICHHPKWKQLKMAFLRGQQNKNWLDLESSFHEDKYTKQERLLLNRLEQFVGKILLFSSSNN